MAPHPDRIKRHILEFIRDSNNRLTPLAVEQHVLNKNPEAPKAAIKNSLKKLIAGGELAYTYELGSSFVEPSFEKPVRVSEHVVIKPERSSFTTLKDDIVVILQKGISFGSGRHPSTRLALRAMESILLRDTIAIQDKRNLRALDIGTGSGILAIAAALMGIQKVIACDTDPCARSEAAENIRLNKLAGRVVIDHRPFESIENTFFMVLANLRFPTLADIAGRISNILEKEGIAVFSGLKIEEINPIKQLYEKENMICIHQFTEKDWASIIFHKTGRAR